MRLSHSLIVVLLLLVVGSQHLISFADNYAPEQTALLDKAQSDGSILAIVSIDAGFVPEGALVTRAAVQEQRAAIASAQAQLLQDIPSAEAYHQYVSVPALAVTVDADALQALWRHELVTSVVEDVAEPPALDSSGGVINAPTVWMLGNEGQGQAVAILDTGVEASHSFFGGRVVAEACFSNAGGAPTGISTVSLCPNGNATQTGAGSADPNVASCLDGGGNQMCDHGTHVAGIAAGGSGQPLSGVAPSADIIGIQVFTRINSAIAACPSPPCVLTFTSDQIAALDHLNVNLSGTFDIASVNMSLGGGQFNDQATCDNNNVSRKAAIDNLRALNIATVIAAGNDGFTNALGAPGCISTAVGIGASTDYDNIASFSNMHAMVDLFAPGVSITSSFADGTNAFATINGTSMASPQVAGAWAVLKAMHPDATVAEIQTLLATTTAATIDDTRLGGTVTGKPRIDLLAAVQSLSTGIDWGITPANAAHNQPINQIGNQTLTINNSATDETLIWAMSEDGDPTRGSQRAAQTTLTHSATQAITSSSVNCNSGSPNFLHTDNSFYRVFDLADFGINDPFAVSSVEVGIGFVAGGSQLVEVKLHQLNGALSTANLTLIGSAKHVVVAGDVGFVISIPVSGTVPANGILVVEIMQPNGQHATDGKSLSLGFNNAGQSDSTYLRATSCGINTITDLANFDPDGHLVLNVVGTEADFACADPADIPWLSVSPTSGTVTPGGTQDITLTFDTNGLINQTTFTGVVCLNGVDSDEPLITIPVTLNVGAPTAVSLSNGVAQTGMSYVGLLVIGLFVISGCAVVGIRKR